MDGLCEDLRNRESFEIENRAPEWAKPKFKSNKILRNTFNVFGKWHEHMWGKDYLNALDAATAKMNTIEVDRTKVKPVVKITGEFWAQITEGDGNFNMFNFLEREGAQVVVEPIATWVAYLMYQAKAHAEAKWPVSICPLPQSAMVGTQEESCQRLRPTQEADGARRGRDHVEFLLPPHHQAIGRITHHLVPQKDWPRWRIPSTTSSPVAVKATSKSAKNVYYTVHHLCHMVLALKPFGCMPSSQSDGVQSAVINKFKDMIFLPIETSGEGEVNAHSRVQMALGEAKVKAKAEFEQCLNTPARA